VDSLEFDATGGEGRPPLGLTGQTGKQIGRYLVGQPLGSGGAATVFRAYDQVQGVTVALKLLLPGADEKAYDRFRREATLAGALRHPHIVRILQIGIAPKGEVAYIAMELVEGESLSDLLTMRGRLRPEETANVLEPIARALAYAHRQGVVHRDVKPGNILLRTASPGASNSVQLESLEYPVIPLLSDFGIARALDAPELTVAGRTVGTPAYMAPEQCAGSREVDGRADIYSLGAVLYRCITGRLPYSGTTTQILHAQVYEPLVIEDSVLRMLPPLLVEVLQRSMAKRPEDRYHDADTLADALALAAGRMTPQPSDNQGEGSTATLTLSALPVTPPRPAAPSATVLVPGLGEGGAAAGPVQPPAYTPPVYAQQPYAQPSREATPRSNPLIRPVAAPPGQNG
jgi:serine/threonine-protein kinase